MNDYNKTEVYKLKYSDSNKFYINCFLCPRKCIQKCLFKTKNIEFSPLFSVYTFFYGPYIKVSNISALGRK